ncbi:MAG: RluA family pseudouridine synthase [Patescibacteria group bacterium]
MIENITIINSNSQGQRLDKFLVEKLPELSRSQIQKAIKDGLALVNDKKVTVHHFLKAGDVVKIIPLSSKEGPGGGSESREKKNKPSKPLPASPWKGAGPKIIADEPEFLIIEKPAGLLVHPTEKGETDTLADWLIAKYPKLKKIGEDPSRPAIVHRLDKEVSGLMLIPKTQEAFDYFKNQFKKHTIVKKYSTLVCGQIAAAEGEIDLPIGRSKNKAGLFAAKPHSQWGEKDKKAVTRFKVIKKFKNYTLLEVEILTGRTHQIRVHMLALGHPVLGDQLYGKKPTNKKTKTTPERIFLHATRLAFSDQQGQPREFISPWPAELENFIRTLK